MSHLFFVVWAFAIIAGIYFLARFIEKKIKKQDSSDYKKKIGITFAIGIVSFFIFIATAPNSDSTQNENKKAVSNEKISQDKKVSEEKISQEKKLAEEKAAAEKQKAEELKKQQEQQAALERQQQEQASQQARKAAEKVAFQNWDAKIQQGISSVDSHWEELWQYTLTNLSNGIIDVQTAFLTLRDLEHKLIDDEMIFLNASIPEEISAANREDMNKIKQGLQAWTQSRRKACEKFRMSLGTGNLNMNTVQESTDMINTGDAVMLRTVAELAVLESKFETP